MTGGTSRRFLVLFAHPSLVRDVTEPFGGVVAAWNPEGPRRETAPMTGPDGSENTRDQAGRRRDPGLWSAVGASGPPATVA